MTELADFEPTQEDVRGDAVVFQFDLTPTDWPSELLDLAANGRVDSPWVGWSRDRRSFLAIAPFDGEKPAAVAARLAQREGEWVTLDFAVDLSEHPGMVTSKFLADSLDHCLRLAERFKVMYDAIDGLLEPWRTSARGATSRRSDVAYAALAARYVELVRSGEIHPAKVLGAELGMSAASVTQRISEARGEGLDLLSGSGVGRAGGVLTDKAKRLLIAATSTN